MAEKVIDRVGDAEEFAFICDEVDLGLQVATLRTYPFSQEPGGNDNNETMALDNFAPDYSVSFRKQAAGVLHFFDVKYTDGTQGIILTNTVFPDGTYHTEPEWSAASIAFELHMLSRLNYHQ